MSQETVLITGASSGIGRELAKCFAAEGCRLVLTARNTVALDSLAQELEQGHHIEARVLPADLAQPDAPVRLYNQLHDSGIAVDVLVNNAGFGSFGPFAETDLPRQLAMMPVNITALTHLTGLLLPRMLEKRGGGILNVASTAAFQPGPGMAVYYATKAYVLSFTEALAEELAHSGIAVTALCPGPTATQFAATARFRGSDLLTKGAMSAASVARYGHRAFRRGKVVAIPGLRNRVLTFSVRLGPRAVVRKAVKFLNAIR